MGSVLNRGSKSKPAWYIKFKDVDGRQKMTRVRVPTAAKARELLSRAEVRVADGMVGVERPRAGGEKTFGEALKHWLATHSAVALTSHHDNLGRAKHLEKALGRLPLSQVNADRINAFRAQMAGRKVKDNDGVERPKYKPATVNRTLALLRKCLNDSVLWGDIKAAPKVKLLPVAEQPFDYLAQDECERFLSHANAAAPNDAPLYHSAIYLGARMGELYGMRWADVDLAKGLVTIRRSYGQPFTKSKKIRHVRVNRQLGVVLKGWKDRCPKCDLGLVFPEADGSMRVRERPPKDFADLLAAARCHAVTFHALRHTCASLLVMANVSLRAVQKQLGHSTITTTERYSHLEPAFMANEADRLNLNVQQGLGALVALDGGR
jgi:integrase